METYTADEFKKKYGVMAYDQLGQQDKKSGLFQEIKDAFSQGVGKAQSGVNQIEDSPGLSGLVPGVGKIAGGATEAITAPAAPLLNRTIGKAVGFVADKLSNIPGLQKFAMSPTGQKTAEVADTFSNYGEAAGLATGLKGAKVGAEGAGTLAAKAGEAIPTGEGVRAGVGSAMTKTSEMLPSPVSEALGTKQSWIDHNLATALNITPGDLAKISKSTGNEVGTWMADNNLIGTNKANTVGLVKNFFTDNYKQVRTQIDAVKKDYSATEVPHFQDTLKTLLAETAGKIGLENVSKEITSLLNKDTVRLKDVQRVKELLDDHYSLYKATGDVQSGVAKQGLANVRNEMKTFIEKQVQENTGADIRQLNNNVATAKSLADTIETRSPKGITRAQITWRDAAIGLGLTYFGSPLAGLAAVAAWKIMTSPSIRLRFARFLDGLNDAEKKSVSEMIRDDKLTPELKKVLDVTNQNPSPEVPPATGQ